MELIYIVVQKMKGKSNSYHVLKMCPLRWESSGIQVDYFETKYKYIWEHRYWYGRFEFLKNQGALNKQ